MRHAFLVSLSFVACVAHAETLLGVDFGGQAYHIDSATGAGTAFGPGAMGLLNALAYHQGTFSPQGRATAFSRSTRSSARAR